MPRIIRILFILFLFPCGVFGQIGFGIIGNGNSVTIPIEVVNNLIILPVKLDGTIPLKFILDSGVKNTILTDRSFTDILDVEYDRRLQIIGADGNAVDAYLAKNLTLEFPGMVGKGQAMIVLQEDYLQLRTHLGIDVHGIIGFEIFNRFVVEIDYSNSEITLHEPFKYRRKRFLKKVPIEIVRSKCYMMADIALVGGTIHKDCPLMVDTGASHSLLFDFGNFLGIEKPDKSIATYLGRALGGEIQGSVARIDALSFSKYRFENVLVSFSETNLNEKNVQQQPRAGTVGGEIFSRFRVIIDYFQKHIYFARNRDYKKNFEFNMSGIAIIAGGKNLNEYYIEKVSEDSPAHLVDVRPGDKLAYVNGMKAGELKLSVINSMFRAKDGKRIKLKIERGEEKLVKRFRLEKII